MFVWEPGLGPGLAVLLQPPPQPPTLLAAGNHGGATYHELRRFAAAALEGAPPEVSLRDGSLAVMMGVAAQRSIELGAPVAWADMVREYMSHDVNGVLQPITYRS